MISENSDGSFMCHVMSNAQPEIFNNKSNDFKNRLLTSLSFDKTQNWEVGLKEFSYVNNVDTVVDMPGGEEHSLTVGKLYEEYNLIDYLPHYNVEGGSVMKEYPIFIKKDRKLDQVNVIHSLDLMIRKYFNPSVLRMESDYSSLFYVGSNGVDVRHDIYSLYFGPPTNYQRLSNKEARYALIFSPALAQALQIKKCVHVNDGQKALRIPTGIAAKIPNYVFPTKVTETEYAFNFDAYTLSIVPLHRCLFSTREIKSTSLATISLMEFLTQLQWNELGYLSLDTEYQASFNFEFEGLVGIDYHSLKRFITQPGVSIEIGCGQKIIFPRIDTLALKNTGLDTEIERIKGLEKELDHMKAEVDAERKRSTTLNEQQRELQNERDKVSRALAETYSKVKDGTLPTTWSLEKWGSFIQNDLKQRELRARQIQIQKQLKQTLHQFIISQRRLQEQEAKYEQMKTEQMSYYKDKYSQDPPIFFNDIPQDLDVFDYLARLDTICNRNRTRGKNATTTEEKVIYDKELQDLKTFAEANSCLVFFETEQQLLVHIKGSPILSKLGIESDSISITYEVGAYTPGHIFDIISKAIQKGFKQVTPGFDVHRSLNVHGALTYKFSVSLHTYVVAQTDTIKKFILDGRLKRDPDDFFELHGEHSHGDLMHGDVWGQRVMANDLYLSESSIREYVNNMQQLIDSPTPQMATLTRLAQWGSTMIHLKSNVGFKINLKDTSQESVPNSVKESLQYTLLQDVKGPLSLTVQQGFYTPYSLAKAFNDLIPAQNMYWFEVYNDVQYYFFKIHLMENTSIEFDKDWSVIFPVNAGERVFNGTIFKVPIIMFRASGGKEFPFKNVDLAQVRLKQDTDGKTFIQRFVYEMYLREARSGQKEIRHSEAMLRNNLNHGFQKNEDTMFYFTKGMRMKVIQEKHKSLEEIRVPYDKGRDIIHLYSNKLRQSDTNMVLGIKDQAFLQPFHRIPISQGQYTASSLVKSIQRQITPWNPKIEFKLDSHNFLTIQTGPHDYIDLRNMQDLFNLDIDFVGPDTVYTTPVPIDLVPASYNIIIYSNLVGESVVGGQRERILRIFPKERKQKLGEPITHVMVDIDYYPLYLTEISDIHIQFMGDDGFPVPLHLGRSYVKLHIRKREKV